MKGLEKILLGISFVTLIGFGLVGFGGKIIFKNECDT